MLSNIALIWIAFWVFLFILVSAGLRVAWELLKLAVVVGFCGAVLIILGVL